MGSNAGGFNFDLCRRNVLLEEKGVTPLKTWKTGTTIAGILFKDGVVLGADTRSTAGEIVADKNCEKIHYLSENIRCCGAGTAADCDAVTRMVKSGLVLHQFATNRKSRVITALTMIRQHLSKYQGYIGAALILGGVDLNGPHLFTIYPHGSTDALPFATMGSGGMNAMAVLESGYRDDMSRQEAMDLVARAIKSGIYSDLGSGSNVDLCVIEKDKTNLYRNYEVLDQKTYVRQYPVSIPSGTARVLKERVVTLKDVEVIDGESMDLS